MKQIGTLRSLIQNGMIRRQSASGTGPIEIVGVDSNGAATPSSEIEFRQGALRTGPPEWFDNCGHQRTNTTVRLIRRL